MTHPPNERNKTRRNKSEDGRRRGKKTTEETSSSSPFSRYKIKSGRRISLRSLLVFFVVFNRVPLLKWQKQERMKMTNDFLGHC